MCERRRRRCSFVLRQLDPLNPRSSHGCQEGSSKPGRVHRQFATEATLCDSTISIFMRLYLESLILRALMPIAATKSVYSSLIRYIACLYTEGLRRIQGDRKLALFYPKITRNHVILRSRNQLESKIEAENLRTGANEFRKWYGLRPSAVNRWA
jgi:hypothetical protein